MCRTSGRREAENLTRNSRQCTTAPRWGGRPRPRATPWSRSLAHCQLLRITLHWPLYEDAPASWRHGPAGHRAAGADPAPRHPQIPGEAGLSLEVRGAAAHRFLLSRGHGGRPRNHHRQTRPGAHTGQDAELWRRRRVCAACSHFSDRILLAGPRVYRIVRRRRLRPHRPRSGLRQRPSRGPGA